MSTSYLPSPITKEAPRILNMQAYKQKILSDELMVDPSVIVDYGNNAFNDLSNLIDLTDIDSIKADNVTMRLPSNFIPINPIAADFLLTVKPHNGMSSLRKGFYRLEPEPQLITIMDFKAWSMNVLFNEGPSSDKIFRYKCNVGPLLNKFAVCYNLTNKERLQFPNDKKRQTLMELSKRTIYVSSAELVNVNETFKPYETKEVLWFVWGLI